jgi:PKD repeat protein
VVAADAAVPDNAGSADQTGTASQANRSDPQCDTVVLDRQGPTLAVNASKTAVRVGEQVAFSSEASDSGSGLDSNTLRWAFGDGTPTVADASVTRAFQQPGTYAVTLRVKDRAGNESVAQRTITVEAPPSDGGIPGGNTPGGSTPGGNTPPGNGPTPGTNGGTLASVKIGSVTVLVPKRVRLGRIKRLVVGARADQAGRLTLSLVRGKKVYSKLVTRLAAGQSSHRLRLPKRLKAGTYAIRIAFKPTGESWSAAGSAKVAFQKAKGR